MRCGRLKRAGAHYTGPGSAGIQWVKRGCWIRTLGIPVGEDFREEDFLMDKYNKCRRLFSRWGPYIVQYLTGYGRAMIINTLYYSRFRFYAQDLCNDTIPCSI